jgi:uncharacterized membrane protein
VVFAMLSTHYAPAWSAPDSGWVLAIFLASAAAIRQFFVLWHSGQRAWWLLALGALLLGAALAWLMPRSATPTEATTTAIATPRAANTSSTAVPVPLDRIHAIVSERCGACHSTQSPLMGAAPKGLVFETDADISAHAAQIVQQTSVLKIMPPGNLTGMTEDERALIARWYQQRP